jgi:hypothetical protein
MKLSGHYLKVYLALFLLIVLVAVFPYREGFNGDTWFDFTPWFMKKEKKEDSDSEKEKKKDKNETKDKYDDYYGTGLSGRSYTTTETTNDSSNNIATEQHKWLDTSNWGTYTKTE